MVGVELDELGHFLGTPPRHARGGSALLAADEGLVLGEAQDVGLVGEGLARAPEDQLHVLVAAGPVEALELDDLVLTPGAVAPDAPEIADALADLIGGAPENTRDHLMARGTEVALELEHLLGGPRPLPHREGKHAGGHLPHAGLGAIELTGDDHVLLEAVHLAQTRDLSLGPAAPARLSCLDSSPSRSSHATLLPPVSFRRDSQSTIKAAIRGHPSACGLRRAAVRLALSRKSVPGARLAHITGVSCARSSGAGSHASAPPRGPGGFRSETSPRRSGCRAACGAPLRGGRARRSRYPPVAPAAPTHARPPW